MTQSGTAAPARRVAAVPEKIPVTLNVNGKPVKLLVAPWTTFWMRYATIST